MLVDWNEGYISVCPTPDLIPVEDKHTYIPTSTWGYIRGDISEQKDLMNLLTTIESGLTAEQIALLVDADERIDEVKADVIELDQKHNTEIGDINSMLNSKVNITDVYTKSEIDSKGYLTEHQSLAGYATENWVYQRGYISAETDPIWSAEKHKYALKSELPSTAGFATESWVKEQGYITEHQSLDNYYTKNEVDAAIENVEVDLTGYATEDWVKQQNYLTEHQSLAGYATEDWVKQQNYLTEHQSLADYYTKSEVDAAIENVEVDLTGYATEDWVKQQGYITEHQSLAGYATEDWVKQQNYLTEHQSLDNYYTKNEVDTAIENVEVDLTGYATESYVDTAVESKVDNSQIWSGTQAEWDAMTATQQNSYTIAMIQK
jgi:hypothetical protein